MLITVAKDKFFAAYANVMMLWNLINPNKYFDSERFKWKNIQLMKKQCNMLSERKMFLLSC